MDSYVTSANLDTLACAVKGYEANLGKSQADIFCVSLLFSLAYVLSSYLLYGNQEGISIACHCNINGSFSENCNSETGQCDCRPNVVGRQCNECKACDCSIVGSLSLQCDPDIGCCLCRPEFSGNKCDECRLGYHGHPNCNPCECLVAGTEPSTCELETGKCSCTDPAGQCKCKVNVEGVNCDRCKPGRFGLYARNPLGCSSCYCFGLTSRCSEAKGLIRLWLTLKPDQVILPLVDENVQHQTVQGIIYQYPETIANIDLVMHDLHLEPFYWRLPEQFQGRKLMAYGGKLKYAIFFEARDETGFATYKPQVIIRGGLPTRTQMIVRHVAAPLNGQLTRHEIEMTEHEWKYGDGPRASEAVTREDFMDVLYNVHYILIKATHGSFMRQSRGHQPLLVNHVGTNDVARQGVVGTTRDFEALGKKLRELKAQVTFSSILPVWGFGPGRDRRASEVNDWLRGWYQKERFGFSTTALIFLPMDFWQGTGYISRGWRKGPLEML
ncbi:Laminin subunit alpha-2, partial [Varanus komodoensis]